MLKITAKKSRIKQRGSALLLTVMVLFSTLTLLILSATNASITNTKLSANVLDKQRAILAADSASRYAWEQEKKTYKISNYVENSSHGGHYDLRKDANKKVKNQSSWMNIRSTASWSWDKATRRDVMPNKLSLATSVPYIKDKNNPMKLSAAPQFVKGLHDPILRGGTESFYCMPVSILGAAQGGSKKTRALVEIKVIPRKGCFRSMVK